MTVTPSRSNTLIDPIDQVDQTPPGWKNCLHPQGWIYFFNPTSKFLTDDDIRQLDILEAVTASCARARYDLDEGMEVHLQVSSPDRNSPFNLVVNHVHCIASQDLHEVKDANAKNMDSRTLGRCRRRYWNYVFHHPAHIPTPERALQDASDMLTWYYTDNLISGSKSVVPFSKVECDELSQIVKGLALPCNDSSVSKTLFLAWILRENCRFRDGEHYGEHTAKQYQAMRTERSASQVFVQRPPAYALPIVTFIIKVFFFSIPFTYMAHIQSSTKYRARLATIQDTWATYIERVVREYSHFLLISTVLLSATVGFLAVPNLGKPSWVAGVVSAFASLGSIIIGVFSIWKHQINTRPAASFAYMYNARHNALGLHGHAMLLSLPPVLLVWAILAFSVSIIAFVLQGVSTADSEWNRAAWTVVGFVGLIVIAVVIGLYTLFNFWSFRSVVSCIGFRRGRGHADTTSMV